MIKMLFALLICNLFPFLCYAQHDLQTGIYTDKGIFTVSQTDEGKDLIRFSCAIWDDLVRGTSYSSCDLQTAVPIFVVIKIAGNGLNRCKSGIGFSCGIFDYVPGDKRLSQLNDEKKLYKTILEKIDVHTIKIIFLDEVDWETLQKNEPAP